MKNAKKNFIEKAAKTVAEVSSETISWFAFYEPKMPKKLAKKDNVKEK